MTEAQAKFIADLANRILSVDANSRPVSAKSPVGFKFSPRANAIAAQTCARDILGRMAEFSNGTASACIDDLKVQARRAGL